MCTLIISFCAAASLVAQDAPAKKPFVEPPIVRSLSFAPDGKLLAAATMPKNRGGQVFVWQVADRKLVSKYERAGESPRAVFAPDGKSIVFANGRKGLSVLDPITGEKTGEIGPFAAEVTALAPAGPGKWLSVGKDNGLRLWDETAKKATIEIRGGKRLWGWAVSPAGKWLFADVEGTDTLWDLTTGKEVEGLFKLRPGTSHSATFIGEDRLFLASNRAVHKLIEIPSGKEILRFKSEGGTDAPTFSDTAQVLALRYYSSLTAALTPFTMREPTAAEKERTGALLKECDDDDYAKREKAAAALVELGPAIEPLLRQASVDGPSAEVRMRARVSREMILNKPKYNLVGHKDEVRSMAFSPDGTLFATGGADGLVILWDPKTGKEVGRMNTGE